jgi:hypothetical protein
MTAARCQFPINNEPPFEFCNAEVERPRLPFCDFHAAIVYRREPKAARLQKSRRPVVLPDPTALARHDRGPTGGTSSKM